MYKLPDNWCKGPDMSTGDMPISVAKRLGYALKRAQHALRISMDRALQPVGLTTPQYSVMCALEAEPGMSNARLARAAFVTAQTMQAVLANLEREEIVKREADPANARILRASLTAKGRQVLGHAHRAVAIVEDRMVASVGEEAIEPLAETLHRCAEHLTAGLAADQKGSTATSS